MIYFLCRKCCTSIKVPFDSSVPNLDTTKVCSACGNRPHVLHGGDYLQMEHARELGTKADFYVTS